MKAIIMAGGEGSRLRPLTCNRPKPMVRILDKPVMQYSIELLKKHGITDIGVTLQYLPEQIRQHFGDGSEYGVNLRYFTEESPLGTAGSVKNAQDFLDETFIVISGDALTDIDLSAAIDFHRQKNALATLVLSKVDRPLEYGVVVTDNQGNITRFLEKPGWSEVFSDTVNTGIYILQPDALSFFEAGQFFDFAKDLFPILLEQKKTMVGYIAKGYWCDIGDISAYMTCQYDILDNKVNVALDSRQISPGVWIGQNVRISPSAKLFAPVYIGDGVSIGDHAQIEHYSVVCSDAYIGAHGSLKRAVISRGCHLGQACQIRGCILCDKVVTGQASSVFEQAVVGDACVIGDNAIIKPAIKLWPQKAVEPCAEVNVNMIWGSRHSKTLFGDRGIAGEINVDITPEFASRMGACFGAVNKGGRIAVSRGSDASAAMLQNSVMAGLLSTGCEVYDFGVALLPATRSAIKFYDLSGGLHISAVKQEGNYQVKISFLDKHGANIDRATERKMENLFEREDFARCEGEDIKGIVNLYNYKHFYLRDMLSKLKNEHLNYKLLVNVNSRTADTLIRQAAEELGCELLVTNMQIAYAGDGDLQSLSKAVVDSGFNLGAVFDSDCEKLMLIDDRGRIVADELFAVLASLICLQSKEGTTVVVPVSAPGVVEKLAQEYKGTVIRTKTIYAEIMGQLIKNSADEQFLMNFDAIGAVIKVMDYMKETGKSLSSLVDSVGQFYIERREVSCPSEAKGSVIRSIMEEASAGKVDTTDGVKVFSDNGWVLILPDATRPVCKIIAEGYNEEFASELADIYAKKVDKLGQNRG